MKKIILLNLLAISLFAQTPPGQTGTDFAITVTTVTNPNDTVSVAAGNYLLGSNNFIGTNACNFTLTAGSGVGVIFIWLSPTGNVTGQYTNTGGEVVQFLSGPSTNCAAVGASSPAYPLDGSKQIGSVIISGALTFSTITQQASYTNGWFVSCTTPMLCTPSGPSVNISAGSTIMQSNQTNTFTGGGNFANILTTRCASSASPAVCGSAISGDVNIAVSATTIVVNTTAVTANSEINIQPDSTRGSSLSVTCSTAAPVGHWISARTPGTSFTISLATAAATNPSCYTFNIVN